MIKKMIIDDEGVPAVYMRGGTSKGVFLHARDLPPAGPDRDDLLRRIIGSPDPMQIDGMGGAVSSTSKVIVVEPVGPRQVTYWFAQVGIADDVVDWSGNCGNLTTAVGPFAVDEGLVDAAEPFTDLVLHNANTGVDIEAGFRVADGRAVVQGDTEVAGVPGAGSPVTTRYLAPAGQVLGSLFPDGGPVSTIRLGGTDVSVSLVDVTHPYAFVRATDLGLPDDDQRSPAELNADRALVDRVEALRAECSVRLGRVARSDDAARQAPAMPRIVLVHPAHSDGTLRATAFSMGVVHRALPMTGALCLAAAVRLPGTVAADLAIEASVRSEGSEETVTIEHPRGIATVAVHVEAGGKGIRSVGIVRTARRLMAGTVYPRPR